MHKNTRKWPLLIWLVFLISCFFYEQVFYLIQLGKGQFSILLHTKSIDEVLQSSEGDSIKQDLLLIRKIYAFGTNKLGLSDKGAYQNYYNQKGKPVLWVLTVCKPYSLDPVTWTFPIAGTVSYKGYFNRHTGLIEMKKWKNKGYDVSLEEVYAWSTLGWFKDPVMSEMLNKYPGDIANTLLHEMTHSTIYKAGDIEFNENLASFIGDKGAEAFLINNYGKDSEWIISYIKSMERRKNYSELVLSQAISLDSLYQVCLTKTDFEKTILKENFMMKSLCQLNSFRKYPLDIKDLNNCYFADVNRYRKKQTTYDSLLLKSFNGQLNAFISSFKK
ncbi:MAG: aminopeptidase [Cytophagales bacterium]|nr:aminopeptidase [Cytophaga sp.]